MAGSTTRARVLAAITATGRASWCRISIKSPKSWKRTRSTSNAQKSMRACSSASRTTRMPTRRSASRLITSVVRERDGAITRPTNMVWTTPRAAARAEAQEHVWNEVWKRRILYFCHRRRHALAGDLSAGEQRATRRRILFALALGLRPTSVLSAGSLPEIRVDLDRRLRARGVLVRGDVVLLLTGLMVWSSRVASRHPKPDEFDLAADAGRAERASG